MKNLIFAATIFAAQPALAFDRMLLNDCLTSFENLAELIDPGNTDTPSQLRSIRATFDGWCEINGDSPGFEDATFDRLTWRTDDTALWTQQGIPPMGLELRITGLDPDTMQNSAASNRPPVSIEGTIRQDPAAGQLIIEHASMENDAGDSMTASAVFERVFLSSPSMMQVSAGSAAFKAGLVSMTLDGTYENPFGFNVSVEVDGDENVLQAEAFQGISRLPTGMVNDAARAELMAFAGDLPGPVGTLEVGLASERGLGLMQVGMSMYNSFASVLNDDAEVELDVLFDGVTISADWSPRDTQAD